MLARQNHQPWNLDIGGLRQHERDAARDIFGLQRMANVELLAQPPRYYNCDADQNVEDIGESWEQGRSINDRKGICATYL
jgi:hypothetical protein